MDVLPTFDARALVALLGVAASCQGRTVPHPRYMSHPTSALREVPYPPPPARVEVVPDQPTDEAVWIDGEWTWQGRRWAWKKGRWVTPRQDVFFAPWTSTRNADGTLFVAEGAWRDASGAEVASPSRVPEDAGAMP
jgi:hypothetical protein